MSPELALVDPALRAAARERLDDPDDTLERVIAAARAARLPAPVPGPSLAEARASEEAAEAVRRLAESALAEESAETAEPHALPLSRRFSRLSVVVVAASAGFMIALLAADRALDRGPGQVTPVVSVTTEPGTRQERPSGPAPAQRPVAPSAPSATGAKGKGPTLSPQRFAWAPVAGASGYHVVLHRRGVRVFAADTKRPGITIPPTWTLAGRPYRLEAGEYRWYVWPIVSGRRAARAVVQARLVVQDR